MKTFWLCLPLLHGLLREACRSDRGMKFLIDAHLPRRLAFRLCEAGHDAVHTLDLRDKNQTTDARINAISEQEQRVVMTKHADFVASFLLERKPYKLLLISTGNVTNAELEGLIVPALPAIVTPLDTYSYLELSCTALIIHS